MLREFIAEPSGTIEAILERLGTSPAAVTSELDRSAELPAHLPGHPARPDELSGSSEAFIPASPALVWKLLADPSLMPEWEPMIGSIEPPHEPVRAGDTWVARAPTERTDGKAISVKPKFMKQRIELVTSEEPWNIEWCFTYPDALSANARRVSINLEPAAGGTRLDLKIAWQRNQNRQGRPVLSFVLRPLHRLVLWMQLSQLSNGISRAFR